MFPLGGSAPVTHELIASIGDRPAVTVTFHPQPTPLSLRAARRAVVDIMRDGEPNGEERAGDAFSAALIRHNIISWSGIGDQSGEPVLPTADRDILDDDGLVIGVEAGTISAFLAEPRLFEAADRAYVMPWAMADAEKNGWSPSLNGTSAGATPAIDTASSAAKPEPEADAPNARTKPKRAGRTKVKPSGG